MQNPTNTSGEYALIGIRQIEVITNLSGKTIGRRVKDGSFPAPIVIGRSRRWPRQVVEKWITSKMVSAAKGAAQS